MGSQTGLKTSQRGGGVATPSTLPLENLTAAITLHYNFLSGSSSSYSPYTISDRASVDT